MRSPRRRRHLLTSWNQLLSGLHREIRELDLTARDDYAQLAFVQANGEIGSVAISLSDGSFDGEGFVFARRFDIELPGQENNLPRTFDFDLALPVNEKSGTIRKNNSLADFPSINLGADSDRFDRLGRFDGPAGQMLAGHIGPRQHG